MQWVFSKAIHLLVIKPDGKHYAVQTPNGWVEKDENIVVKHLIANVAELKKLRRDIRNGKFFELADAPINDQLWAILALRSGFITIQEEEEDET